MIPIKQKDLQIVRDELNKIFSNKRLLSKIESKDIDIGKKLINDLDALIESKTEQIEKSILINFLESIGYLKDKYGNSK